jgi:hypothetical protein
MMPFPKCRLFIPDVSWLMFLKCREGVPDVLIAVPIVSMGDTMASAGTVN